MEENRLIELLTRKLAGEATADELTELDALMARHPDSLHLAELLAEIWKPKAKEEDVDLFYRRHKNRFEHDFAGLHADDAKVYGKTKSPKIKYLAAGLCMALLAVLSCLFFLPPENKSSPVYTRIISGKGVRKRVTLPDGSSVWLNADSRLSFAGSMNGKDRSVELSGEAFFDVAHIAGRPFKIHTSKVSITVLGTAFNVKAYPGDKKCETTLIRGTIELTTNDDSRQKFILKPSEKISVVDGYKENTVKKRTDNTAAGSTLLIEHITPVKLANQDYVAETSWTANRLIFENETFEDLAPELERWYNVKINITGKVTAGYRFTGAFANETIAQALMAMSLIKPFNYSIHDRNITIY